MTINHKVNHSGYSGLDNDATGFDAMSQWLGFESIAYS